MQRAVSIARERNSMRNLVRGALLALGFAAVIVPGVSRANDFCPDIYSGGAFETLPDTDDLDAVNQIDVQWEGIAD